MPHRARTPDEQAGSQAGLLLTRSGLALDRPLWIGPRSRQRSCWRRAPQRRRSATPTAASACRCWLYYGYTCLGLYHHGPHRADALLTMAILAMAVLCACRWSPTTRRTATCTLLGRAAWSKCPLGSAQARLLCLLRARLAALGSSALLGRGQPTGSPAAASGARASRLQSRRFHRL